MHRHPHDEIAALRAAGMGWDEVCTTLALDVGPETLRGAHSRWRRNNLRGGDPQAGLDPVEDGEVSRLFTRDELWRITSEEDLLSFFRVDRDRWQAARLSVNKWEMGAKGPTGEIVVTPLYQVRAVLEPRAEHTAERVGEMLRDVIAEMKEHAPAYRPVDRAARLPGTGVLAEIAIFDPHLGMLAHRDEVGGNYDLKIGRAEYQQAAEGLLSLARLYDTARILFVVGNDFLHVDGPSQNGRGGATAAGTPQDVDGRLHKLFSAGRQAIITAVDAARLIAPVDVLVVPGNHDHRTMFHMGEVLSAWYRNDAEVNVIYGPQKRHFYGWGANAFLFTHGEEYRRKRDSLPLIFLDECPMELLAASRGGVREVHTGHNHARMAGGYYPDSEVSETRGIVTRSLPALTPSDAWHHVQGYRHRRAASAFFWHADGGMAGHHEITF